MAMADQLYMVIYGHISIIYGHIWPYMVICMSIHGHVYMYTVYVAIYTAYMAIYIVYMAIYIVYMTIYTVCMALRFISRRGSADTSGLQG